MITLEPDEKIYLITRRHKYVLLRVLIPEVLFFIIMLIFMIYFLFTKPALQTDFLRESLPDMVFVKWHYLLLFFLSLFLQFLWLIIFLAIINYYFDYWIVTNTRTIHAELKTFFSRTLSSVPHDKIQDITIDIHGIFPTIWRFGDLKIQTAGEFREFIFKEIPNPDKVKELIFRARKEFLEKK